MSIQMTENPLLTAQSKEGQTYRETLLRGKRILIVSCGFDHSKQKIYAKAKQLGAKLILLEEGSNTLAALMASKGYFDHWIHLDLSMRDSIVEDCIKEVDAVLGTDQKLDAVVTFWDDAVGLCARIATHYDVKTNTISSIDVAHDKYLTRCALKEAGLPTPLCFRIQNEEELVRAASLMTYPAILKPVQGAASIGVSLVRSEKECHESFHRSVTLMKEVLADGELMGLCFDPEITQDSTFVLEEYLDGEEVDVDLCLYNGEMTYSNINSDWPDDSEDQRFIEMGISFPAKCNDTERGKEFRAAAVHCCKAIGITDGVLHVEMKYSSKYGPVLIELNPRMGGGPLYTFHKECFDVDLVTEHLLLSCGLPSYPPSLWPHRNVCSCVFLYAPKDGTCSQNINESPIAEEIRRKAFVNTVEFAVKQGEVMTGWDNHRSSPTFLGRIDICVKREAMSYDGILQYCKKIQSEAAEAAASITNQ